MILLLLKNAKQSQYPCDEKNQINCNNNIIRFVQIYFTRRLFRKREKKRKFKNIRNNLVKCVSTVDEPDHLSGVRGYFSLLHQVEVTADRRGGMILLQFNRMLNG